MNRLQNHLEQISLSASAIADLQFCSPKPFANALLRPHDITALIRDTEAHERALFSVGHAAAARPQRRATRRGTVFVPDSARESLVSRICAVRDRDRSGQSAVARVLGGDMMDAIQRSTGGSARGGLDVEALLRGAEMLCSVYPVAGARQKIAAIRSRHGEIAASLEGLEQRVADQAAELEQMNHCDDDYVREDAAEDQGKEGFTEVTDADIEREMEAIRALEARKRRLEARVTGLEQDLGGLLR